MATLCREAGIALPSYGSYHGVFNDDPADFSAQLDIAEGLGCGTIRVWSGHWGDPGELSEMTVEQVELLVQRTARVAEMGAGRGIRVGFEYHTHTPTCGAGEVMSVLERAGHDNIYTYFQMLEENRRSVPGNVEDLQRVFSRLAFVHCHWFRDEADTGPLREGAHMWMPLLAGLMELGYDGPLYLEYFKDYTESRLADDLAFLREQLSELTG